MSEDVHELDEVAAALGRRAEQREQDQRAPEWEALARGELTVEAALERRRGLGDEHDLDRAAEYFTPFDPDETAALVDGLLGRADAESDESDELDEPTKAEVVPLPPPAPAPAPAPAPEPSMSGVWWLPAGLLLATAAAILLWIVLPPNADIRDLTDDGNDPIAKLDPLPNYVLETDGGLEQRRGDTSEPPSGRHLYRRDTAFEWILRPAINSSESVGVRGFVFVDGASAGLPLKLDELVQVAKSGAIQITGTIEQLNLEPGRYTIALAVGRLADLPEQAIELGDLNTAKANDETWQIRRIDVELDG